MASKLTDAQLRDRLSGSEATARRHRTAGETHKALQAEERAARMRRELELRESRQVEAPPAPVPAAPEKAVTPAAAAALPQPREMPPDVAVSAVAALISKWGAYWTIQAALAALVEWGRTARAVEALDVAEFHRVEALRRCVREARP